MFMSGMSTKLEDIMKTVRFQKIITKLGNVLMILCLLSLNAGLPRTGAAKSDIENHNIKEIFASSAVATSMSGGGAHTCALTNFGGAKCWGSNFSGQLGDGSTIDRLIPTDVSGLSNNVAALAL